MVFLNKTKSYLLEAIRIVFMIPMYGVLIWTYFCPEDSLLWGKRWMYKEEPEISNSAIRFAKVYFYHN